VGRSQLKKEGDIRRDSLMLLNIIGKRKLIGHRHIWRQTTEKARD
jgi:hypothetical protein